MMQDHNVIIIHGAFGYPDENWFGWLRDELSLRGILCLVPQLPTPERQYLETWMDIFSHAVRSCLNSRTIIIGHSLGAVFALQWLQRQSIPVAAVILVGVFLGKVGADEFDCINQSFIDVPIDWGKCRMNCGKFICYHGADDPYVTQQQADEIALQLKAEYHVIANAGHFNTAAGFRQFPHLLARVWQLLSDES